MFDSALTFTFRSLVELIHSWVFVCMEGLDEMCYESRCRILYEIDRLEGYRHSTELAITLPGSGATACILASK